MSYGYVPPPPGPAAAPMPPPALAPTKSSKKLVWIIVGAMVGIVLLIVLFGVGILSLVFGAIKSSDPYRHAVQSATHDPRVVAALGSPIQPGWLASGSINVTNSSGNADLAIPVKGSAHSGTIYVVAKKSEGVWSYQSLAVRVEGTQERIDLLETPTEK